MGYSVDISHLEYQYNYAHVIKCQISNAVSINNALT